jgi:hexosaminidase
MGIEVADEPAFAWRGVHLDVSRHFMPKGFVLKLIDLISIHKCNVLHLHLTDDQGWRMPVEAYPRLVEVGAWRRESAAGHYRERRYDGRPHGGFYSAADPGSAERKADPHHDVERSPAAYCDTDPTQRAGRSL